MAEIPSYEGTYAACSIKPLDGYAEGSQIRDLTGYYRSDLVRSGCLGQTDSLDMSLDLITRGTDTP